MEGKISLLDTPKKLSLQARSTSLRADLKNFEHTYSNNHDGRKPGKDDIKADAEIARKYKEYNKIRDVLAGKSDVSVLEAASPTKRKKPQPVPKSTTIASPSKKQPQYTSTPRAKRLRPEEVDPYDAPNSVTPRRPVSVIGPTPQRDGQVLGIFDLLSNPGSGRSHATPGSRKRKIAAMLDFEDEENQPVITQTPHRSEKRVHDILDHLAGTPVSQLRVSRNKHSRTPASDSKKFMLSQFFATPSAVRYAPVPPPGMESVVRPGISVATPLRNHVLGTPATKGKAATAPDATPAYLRRSHSFKDRLLSVSEKPSRDNSDDEGGNSPRSARAVPKRPGVRRSTFMPKPASQIAAEMRQREDAMHDDDLDAMREMENEDAGVQVKDSQAGTMDVAAEQVPTRVWKKKGQKRTTRRVIMRPSRVKAVVERTPPHSDPAPVEDEEEVIPEEVPEQQGHEESSEEELHALFQAQEEDDTDDEFHEKPTKTVSKKKKQKPSDTVPKEKSLGRPPKTTKKDSEEQGKKSTYNPNAHSHMNFRSLKIKNKNSKGKGRGRGRFGRR
jgi:hypothetical protein